MAYVLRLNLVIVFICAILPDIVDKPLWALGIGSGRYVGHTLLFVLGVSLVLALVKRSYGLAALLGGLSHLLLDWVAGGPGVPWFYPVVDYGFPAWDFEPSGFFAKLSESVRQYFLLDVGNQLIWVGAIVAAALAIIGLRRLYVARRNRGDRAIGDSEEG